MRLMGTYWYINLSRILIEPTNYVRDVKLGVKVSIKR